MDPADDVDTPGPSCRACGARGPLTASCATSRAAAEATRGSWLDPPPGARWVDNDDPNPFVRHRELLWSWHRAQARGWSDQRFVDLVRRLDDAVAAVDGTGFVQTPVTPVAALGSALGVVELLVKDETGNVAGSHKARHLFGLALHLAVEEVPAERRLAISSCGNAALGAATVAAAAGRPLDVFIPTWADPVVVDALDALGATIAVCHRVDGRAGDPCMLAFRDALTAGAIPFGCQASENLMALDGGRTLGWELARSWASGGPIPAGAAAGHLLVQVGGGALATSVAAGVLEARRFGVVDDAPRLHVVQTEGCAPFDRAFGDLARVAAHDGPDAALHDGATRPDRYMRAWEHEPTSAATGILDDVTYDWLGIARGLFDTGGTSVVVPEAAVLEAHRLARLHTAVPVDPTGTAGLSGLVHLHDSASGLIGPGEPVTVLFTGRDRSRAT